MLFAAGILAIFIIQACAPFLDIGHGRFGLVIKCPVRVISRKALEDALKVVRNRGVASYHFELVLDNGDHVPPYDYQPKGVAIKTDKVFVTELAQSQSKDGLTAIGSSLSHHLYSPRAADIAAVLGAINPQTN
jgi:hypothetical protein